MFETRLTAFDLRPFSTGASAGWPGFPGPDVVWVISDRAFIEHRVTDFDESSDIGPGHIVARAVILLGGLEDGFVNALHDLLEPAVDLFRGPLGELHILGQLQPRDGDSARVRRLAGCVEHTTGGKSV